MKLAPPSMTPARLLAELIGEAVRSHVGSVGVLVRDVSPPDPTHLLQLLSSLRRDEGVDLRIAYLREGGSAAAKSLGLDSQVFSCEVEQAERWRNDRDLEALIVVVAHGDEAKLSSLADFAAVTSRGLKAILVARVLGGQQGGQNDVQMRWWRLLGNDDAVGLAQLCDYYLSLAEKTGTDFLDSAALEIHRLGLLPDPQFFNDPKESAIVGRRDSNRELVRRLQTLTPKDRRVIATVVNSQEDPTEKRLLLDALEQLDRARWEGAGLQAISFQAAERLVRARTRRPDDGAARTRSTTDKASNIAALSLVDAARASDVQTFVEALQTELNSTESASLRPQAIRVSLRGIGSEAVTTARLDIVNSFGRLLGDGVYGGLVRVEASDLESALRRLDSQQHLVTRWERAVLIDLLDALSIDEGGEELKRRFLDYDRERERVLPWARSLAVEPLAVAANPSTRAALSAFIASHEALCRAAASLHDRLFDRFGGDAHVLLEHLLLLETAVFRTSNRTYVLAAPTHPLFLWHYAKYCETVESQKGKIEPRDHNLIADAAENLPNFLSSFFLPATAVGSAAVLPFLGRLGPLPYFGDEVEASVSDDGATALQTLLDAYLALEPQARLGLRAALVDPPNVGQFLGDLASMAEAGELTGAHVTVFRHSPRKTSIDLRLNEAEEDPVAQIFCSLKPGRRFTFEVDELPDEEVGPGSDRMFHFVVIFDRSGGQRNPTRPTLHPIQPLALPRRIRYSHAHKTVELEPAPGGPFEVYDKLVAKLAPGGSVSYLAVHQSDKLREALSQLAARSPWMVVADRHVDRDLRLGALRIATTREGDRDIVGFSRSTAAFRRPLRDVVRNYNAYISDEQLDELLGQLSELLDAGLLSLRPDLLGNTNHNRVKGLLGTLIAARWFRQSPGTGQRMLVSLDGAEARRWLHLSDDPSRADLVGFDWSNDHCTVSVIEVKAIQQASSEYVVGEGVVRGPAVVQMLSTRRLLQEIFSHDRAQELITTPARREILREHLYRELTKGSYSHLERQVWADRLQRLLDGDVEVDLRCHIVDVRLGVDSSSLRDRNAVALDGDQTLPVRVTELNERHLPSLTPPPPSEPPVASLTPQVTREASPAALGPADSLGDRGSVETETHVVVPTVSAQSTNSAQSEADRPRALLGLAPGAYGKQREIWFDPELPSGRLPNPHIAINGETGSGKTQVTKAIVSDLKRHGIPALILDFKDDYSSGFEDLHVYDPSVQPLPFNPLALARDPRSGQVSPTHHIHQLSEIIKRIYGLGDQQAYRLREAMKAAYDVVGIGTRPQALSAEHRFPAFEAIRDHLDPDKDAKLLGRLSTIFDLELFSAEAGDTQLSSVFAESTVVRLAQLPGDESKNAVAEFFLMVLYSHLVRLAHAHRLTRVLVLDEAWRLVKSPFLEPLMREGRAFGLGVFVATQLPKDLPPTVSGSCATKLFFSQTNVDQIREIQRTITGKTSGPEADHLAGVLRGLTPLTCVLHSKQHAPFARLTVKPYFERIRGEP